MIFRIIFIASVLIASTSALPKDFPPIENGVSQDLAEWRAKFYSNINYGLLLRIKKKSTTLKGTLEISLEINVPEKNQSSMQSGQIPIILDWRKIKGSENLSRISNVTLNGEDAPFEVINEHIVFRQGVIPGENQIKLDFESPILTSGSAVTRYIDKEDGSEYVYSLFVPSDASTAFPIFDQPDLKARFFLNLNVPKGWVAVSNTPSDSAESAAEFVSGRKSKKISDPTIDYYFKPTLPISSYVFAFAAGEFEGFEEGRNPNVQVRVKTSGNSSSTKTMLTDGPFSASRIYVRKSQAKKFKPHAEEIFRLNRQSIKYLEEYFDYKFPFLKYDLVLIPEFPFGGMEHAGATFLRESSIIFPTEPTANNYISRASLLFHENAHQWFGDTVTMKWFDDLWLKEGFATFMAYKAMEEVLPEYNAWKVFYERTKPRAYATDVTKGTTPIYQKIPNLNSAKSAYGNIVYQKAPGFLKQAEFYLGEEVFKTAVRTFLKEHEFGNAEWSDLVSAFEKSSGKDLKSWADTWVKKRGLPAVRVKRSDLRLYPKMGRPHDTAHIYSLTQDDVLGEGGAWEMKTQTFIRLENGATEIKDVSLNPAGKSPKRGFARYWVDIQSNPNFRPNTPVFVFPNYKDFGYGIFLLDPKSRNYVAENIQNERDGFLRSMMWGSLWDSVRFGEFSPKEYIAIALKNISIEKDVSTISSILGRVNTAYTYYLRKSQQKAFEPKIESFLISRLRTARTSGERITYYRALLAVASSENARNLLKRILRADPSLKVELPKLRTRDKFDIVSRLVALGDKEAPRLLAELEKSETSDAAKRYAYAARAGFATSDNKAQYWDAFVNDKKVSESWIDAAVRVWNSPRHSALTLPYLERALSELPDLKQNRKIFFVNGWLASFIGGQTSEEAFAIVNKFLTDNPDLDIDLRRKILERLDGLERAVRIRKKYSEE